MNRFQLEQWAQAVLWEAEMMSNTVNRTTDAQDFFMGYDRLIGCMRELAAIEHTVKFKGERPSKTLAELLTRGKRTAVVNDFIDRCVQDEIIDISKMKSNAAKKRRVDNFENPFRPYMAMLFPESVAYLHEAKADLQRQAESYY